MRSLLGSSTTSVEKNKNKTTAKEASLMFEKWVGKTVLVFHGEVCPRCLKVPSPQGPADSRWLPGKVWGVTKQRIIISYDFITTQGYYFRHTGLHRRWLQEFPLTFCLRFVRLSRGLKENKMEPGHSRSYDAS